MKKLTFALLFAVLSFSTLSPAIGAPTQPAVENGQLKPAFLARHNTNYSFETGFQSDIKNQGSIGVCHLFSLVSQLEQRLQKRAGVKLPLSTSYLVYHWWLFQIDSILGEGVPVNEIPMGGNFVMDVTLVRRVGLIPQSAWQQNPNYNLPVFYSRTDEYIHNIVDRGILAAKAAAPSARKDILLKARAAARKLVNDFMGTPPTQLVVNGEKHSPQSFAAKFYPELLAPTREYMIDARHNGPRQSLPQDMPGNIRQVIPLNDSEKIVKETLDKGGNVYLSYLHNGDFVDNKTGIMTIGGFQFPSGAGPLSRKDRMTNKLFDSGHAVQIVGYDLDPRTQKIIKFKIKNSWGETPGTSGYYHMYVDYFRAFAFALSVF